MLKNQISVFSTTLFIICFFFITFIENANAQGPICILNIEKVSIPALNTPFDFIITGDVNEQVVLSDPGNPTTFIPLNDPETVTVTEELPTGWELESIECEEQDNNCGDTPCLNITIDEESNSITAQCFDDDTGTCTFTNTLIPAQVPTLSEWGLMALAGLLAVIGFVVIRRKQLLTNT